MSVVYATKSFDLNVDLNADFIFSTHMNIQLNQWKVLGEAVLRSY